MWIVHSTLYFGHKQTLCLPNKYLKKERFCISDSFTTRSTLNSFSTKWSKSKYICIVNFEKIRRETLMISNFLIYISDSAKKNNTIFVNQIDSIDNQIRCKWCLIFVSFHPHFYFADTRIMLTRILYNSTSFLILSSPSTG